MLARILFVLAGIALCAQSARAQLTKPGVRVKFVIGDELLGYEGNEKASLEAEIATLFTERLRSIGFLDLDLDPPEYRLVVELDYVTDADLAGDDTTQGEPGAKKSILRWDLKQLEPPAGVDRVMALKQNQVDRLQIDFVDVKTYDGCGVRKKLIDSVAARLDQLFDSKSEAVSRGLLFERIMSRIEIAREVRVIDYEGELYCAVPFSLESINAHWGTQLEISAKKGPRPRVFLTIGDDSDGCYDSEFQGGEHGPAYLNAAMGLVASPNVDRFRDVLLANDPLFEIPDMGPARAYETPIYVKTLLGSTSFKLESSATEFVN